MKQPPIAGEADRRRRTPGTKRFAVLLAAFPALALAAATESETFVWKDCPAEVKVHAIREFMEIAQRDDLVVYSTTPGKLSGVCGRAKVPELKAKLAAASASARAAAARAAQPLAAPSREVRVRASEGDGAVVRHAAPPARRAEGPSSRRPSPRPRGTGRCATAARA